MDDVEATRQMMEAPEPYWDEPLGVKVYSNATILPFRHVNSLNGQGCGIITDTGEHVSVLDIGDQSYPYDECDVESKDCIAILLGLFHPMWGHCITDNIKKIWFLSSPQYQELKQTNSGIEMVYVSFEGFGPQGNFEELLTMIGVDVKELQVINRPTRYRRVIVPDDSLVYNRTVAVESTNSSTMRFWTKEQKRVYDNLLHKCLTNKHKGQRYRKIYLSRKHWSDSRDIGGGEIELRFQEIGFKVIYPEQHTLMSMLDILSGCDVLAGTEGSIMHNAVFLRDGAEVVIIRKGNYFNSYQYMINHMKGLKCTYIDSHLSYMTRKIDSAVGPFYLYVNDNLQRWIWQQTGVYKRINSFSFVRLAEYYKRIICEGIAQYVEEPFYQFRLKEEIEREGRHKYYKMVNRLLPRFFPWKY